MIEDIFKSYLTMEGAMLIFAVIALGLYVVFQACKAHQKGLMISAFDEGFRMGMREDRDG